MVYGPTHDREQSFVQFCKWWRLSLLLPLVVSVRVEAEVNRPVRCIARSSELHARLTTAFGEYRRILDVDGHARAADADGCRARPVVHRRAVLIQGCTEQTDLHPIPY